MFLKYLFKDILLITNQTNNNMKRVYFMLAIVLAIISSCIKTIIVESTSNEKMLLSKSIEEEDCYVYLTVKNSQEFSIWACRLKFLLCIVYIIQ